MGFSLNPNMKPWLFAAGELTLLEIVLRRPQTESQLFPFPLGKLPCVSEPWLPSNSGQNGG